jgi:chemotaxis protein histidine kinase CheA
MAAGGGVGGGDVTVTIGGDASGAQSALTQVSNSLAQIAEVAAGVSLGEAFLDSISTAIGALGDLFNAVMSVNASIEQFTVQMGVLFDNASQSAGSASDATAGVASVSSSAANTIARAQQSMADATQDHTRALQQLSEEAQTARDTLAATLTQLAQTYQTATADLAASHDQTVAKLDSQESDATANFNEQLAQRATAFQEAMQSLSESHAHTMQTLADQLQQLTDTYQTEQAKRDATFAKQNDLAPDSYEKQRKTAASTIRGLQADLADAQRSGDTDLVAALQARIAEETVLENQSFDAYKAGLVQQQQATQAAADQQYQAKVAKVQQQIDYEDQRYQEQSAKLQQTYNNDVQHLREALDKQLANIADQKTRELAAYDKAVADKANTYAKDVANAQKAEQQKLDALQQRFDQENLLYARHIRDLNEQIAHAAAGGGGGAGGTAARNLAARTPISSELPQEKADLLAMTGAPSLTGPQYGQALNQYLEQSTLGTPFTADDLRAASRTLTGYQMSTTKWMGTIADTAAGMGISPQYVSQLLGRIASGQGGFAIREFGALGAPLQGLLPKGAFGANDQLLIPPEQVMPLIMQGLQRRYGGMALKESQTLPGLLSNFADFGLMAAQTVGGTPMGPTVTARRGAEGRSLEAEQPKPGIYQDIEGELAKVYGWLAKNQDAVQNLADAIREQLHRVFVELQPTIADVEAKLEGWLTSGQAERDVTSLGDAAVKLVDTLTHLGDTIDQVKKQLGPFLPIIEDLAIAFAALTVLSPVLVSLASLWTILSGLASIFATVATVIGTVLGISALLAGAILVLIAAVGLLVLAWINDWGGIREKTAAVWADIQNIIQTTWTAIRSWLDNAWAQLQNTVNQVFQSIKDRIELAFLQAALSVANILNGMLGTIQDFINSAVDALNKFLSPILAVANAALTLAGKPTLSFTGLTHVSLGGINTSGIQGQIGTLQSQIDYAQLGASVAAALQANPPVVQMDGVTLTRQVRTNLIQIGRGSGSVLGPYS